ncbi:MULTISPECIES: cytochrome c biogenesis protein DipZ [unclassified Rhizobium]|uniref:cytochrome c biogenesis protein DipZ n=1 Tax=unclassified Rhizobium TaxID=2613769 RepID=UPI0016089690|nr:MULTISPECIES: cytochrome c biogenesis protein DipZ [unclassified Rhizobium]MBB3541260.1 cytochrome c biogenesis protein CcdA/thiol-disulfide isomerase/thioredoxin [Rhizobium sp. BK399]MCS3739985.1 cytochrome c biogenesis protein CcdA/thiol-disulfide isomerase/thioredoxin [Rhizobium sp. BK661]MCS4092065.1 cytochrome c biogenesis protein CcdA/thiol-disulfide isomerase/thioredoxin [Rhizobium sp. BK176]
MLLFLIAYLAGALTIVSPCILPVLPFVLSRAGQPFARSILPMLVGMIVTFAGVATLAAVGGSWAVHANEIGRYAAIALIAGFGVTLLSPRIAAVVTRPAVALGSRLSQQASGKGGVSTSFLLGVATGLLWAPCAGPILGLVLTGAALQGANVQTTLLLTAYAAGAATSLAMAVLAGEKVFAAMKRSLGVGERLRQGLGIAVLAGVTAIALGLDTGLLSRLSYASSAGIEQSLLDKLHGSSGVAEPGGNAMQLAANDARKGYQSDLPVLGRLQSLDGAVEWLNSKPLTAEELRGKVVLVDFWTYSCINCIRTIPYVRAWAEKYRDQGLVVIGVHSPEFAFEKRIDNVRQAIDKFQIGYPVAIDNNFKIWRSFANNYWPAHYFIDAKGQIRHTQFGEGDYEQSERVIQDLLAEAAGSKKADAATVAPDAKGAEAAPDLARLQSGESYIGYLRAANFISPEGVKADAARDYTVGEPGLNEWGLTGKWTVGGEQASLDQAGGGITYRFSARDLHLVLGPGADGKKVRFQVKVDGAAPGADHGSDIDADGNGTVSETRLYQLVRQSGEVRERTFEIHFLDPGVEAFVFTFG